MSGSPRCAHKMTSKTSPTIVQGRQGVTSTSDYHVNLEIIGTPSQQALLRRTAAQRHSAIGLRA
eukprot:4061361-Amphidinium_carterae.1